jgi:hypothetical protein
MALNELEILGLEMTTTDTDSTATQESFSDKDIHFVLKVAQGALASGFLVMGALMLTSPMRDLAGLPFVGGTTNQIIRVVGVAEIVLALGVVLPQRRASRCAWRR